ncbi:shufflon protein C [Salmonella enterica]|nr:shufflon protein C [Salmonella enterica subsp. enterica serovar Heidelberg]ECZ1387961.1 shufflon protein C [Salmonella enterica subsp. enterica serovar Schwarzengrund]EDR9077616.1 shufflon protein C [Salmonella enterica subsp. enterica serovar Hadar]EEJ3543006.1 shufflon protein C [Salmonella enterica subsp. enterica]EEW2595532.1 shufflon protein C [Escherichia coli]HAE5377665.1 shufflon protein C [Salmonella enterica subsp. enterica serovar Newport]
MVGYKVKDVTDVHGADEPIDFHEPDWHGGQCQSGVWQNSDKKERFTVSGGNGCFQTSSYAVCPSGSKLVSGGYRLSQWVHNGYNSPDGSYPDYKNNRWIATGSGSLSCFQAIAICEK